MHCRNSCNTRLIPFPIQKDSLFGFINDKGEIVIPPMFRYCGCFDEKTGLAPAVKDSLFGYIDSTGVWKIIPQFDFAYPFHNGRALVSIDKQMFAIDTHGEILFSFDSLPVSPSFRFCEKGYLFASYSSGSYRVLVDSTGKISPLKAVVSVFRKFSCQFLTDSTLYCRGYKNNRRWDMVYFKTSDSLLIDSLHEVVEKSSEGVIFKDRRNGWRYYSRTYPISNPIVIAKDPNIMIMGPPREGLISFMNWESKTCGYFDTLGRTIIPPEFYTCGDFYNGRSSVKENEENGKFGFIDRKGNVVIPFRYDWVYREFVEKYAIVEKEEQIVILNIDGEELFAMPGSILVRQNLDLCPNNYSCRF